MKITKIIEIAEDIIEIGEIIKNLAIQESFIDFEFRAKQLYMYSKILEKGQEHYKIEEK